MEIKTQMRLDDVDDTYKAFVTKFKPKKTTDDCYTPPGIYEAVAGWVEETYGVDRARFVRPFYPGGDYERYPYKDGDVVVDNPPFSIITKITGFYLENKIPFFLFAPYLTIFSSRGCCHIVCDVTITYDNGAKVNTSFLTNLDNRLACSCPELYNRLKAADDANVKADKPEKPKYDYPDAVMTATMLGYLSKYGVEFSVEHNEATFIRDLDAQRPYGKSLFGGGYLLCRSAAARIAAARIAAARIAAARIAAARIEAAKNENRITWELSERELEIQDSLGKDTDE